MLFFSILVASAPRASQLKCKLHRAQVKLRALRAIARQNEEALQNMGGATELDNESLEAVSPLLVHRLRPPSCGTCNGSVRRQYSCCTQCIGVYITHHPVP